MTLKFVLCFRSIFSKKFQTLELLIASKELYVLLINGILRFSLKR